MNLMFDGVAVTAIKLFNSLSTGAPTRFFMFSLAKTFGFTVDDNDKKTCLQAGLSTTETQHEMIMGQCEALEYWKDTRIGQLWFV